MLFAKGSKISILQKIWTGILIFYIAIFSALMSIVSMIGSFLFGKQSFHPISKIWARHILFVSNIKLDIAGFEQLDINKSYIFTSNHSSLLDIPILLSGLKHNFRIIYKRELHKIPVFGWGLSMSPYISIKRDNSRDSMTGLDEAVQSIRTGESVVVFPEGTRSLDGKLGKFKRGAFLLASRSSKEIVPVTIIGSAKLLPNKSFRLSSGIIRIIISAPIQYSGTSKPDELKLMSEVEAIINSNLEKYNIY